MFEPSFEEQQRAHVPNLFQSLKGITKDLGKIFLVKPTTMIKINVSIHIILRMST